jgi:hypothetical protein
MRCLLFALLLAACHGHDHDGYATFRDCFDEHTMEESLSVQQAIVVCCLDHPIDGVTEVCGPTAMTCEDYLYTNLDTVPGPDVIAACAEYEQQRGM